jgi:hypothetical protein
LRTRHFQALSQRNDQQSKSSLENLASKQKLSGLLKSRRCAHRHRRRSRDESRDHASTCWNFRHRALGSHELASSRVSPRLRASGAGGASRDRTGDLLVANQALSQLSYGPVVHGPKSPAAISADITPSAAGKKRRFARLRLTLFWWVWEELHLRPHPYQGCALTN